jgi:hypothetical protein
MRATESRCERHTRTAKLRKIVRNNSAAGGDMYVRRRAVLLEKTLSLVALD